MNADLSDRLEDRRRTLQVREQDRPERVDALGVIAALAHPPEEPQDIVLRDADDLVGDEAVRFPVHGRQRITRGCFRQAKCLALIGIEPVGEELHPEFCPHLEVGQMRLGDLFGRHSGHVMAIHEQRHLDSPAPPVIVAAGGADWRARPASGSPCRVSSVGAAIHDHGRRPGQSLVDAQQDVGQNNPAPVRRPDQE
jgi:hypothetical protein